MKAIFYFMLIIQLLAIPPVENFGHNYYSVKKIARKEHIQSLLLNSQTGKNLVKIELWYQKDKFI